MLTAEHSKSDSNDSMQTVLKLGTMKTSYGMVVHKP